VDNNGNPFLIIGDAPHSILKIEAPINWEVSGV
jgi:hypothetical protein